MGRPKRVRFDTFHLYDKLHTKKIKMMSDVELTTLYPIKETDQFFQSIEVWAFCSYKFRAKKPFNLNLEIPVITDSNTVKFLEEHCWSDWVDKEIKDKDSDTIESINLLDKLFPDKNKVFFYELDSLIAAYCHGTFSRNIYEHTLKQQQYYCKKYYRYLELIPIFIDICKNSVCYPVAFSHSTAAWSIEKYGKEIAYARAGEIFFVQTPNVVYFDINRHF